MEDQIAYPASVDQYLAQITMFAKEGVFAFPSPILLI